MTELPEHHDERREVKHRVPRICLNIMLKDGK